MKDFIQSQHYCVTAHFYLDRQLHPLFERVGLGLVAEEVLLEADARSLASWTCCIFKSADLTVVGILLTFAQHRFNILDSSWLWNTLIKKVLIRRLNSLDSRRVVNAWAFLRTRNLLRRWHGT